MIEHMEYTDAMREFDKDMDELRNKIQEFWDSVEARQVCDLSREDQLRYFQMNFDVIDRIAIRKHIAESKEE